MIPTLHMPRKQNQKLSSKYLPALYVRSTRDSYGILLWRDDKKMGQSNGKIDRKGDSELKLQGIVV